ncbi:MAG: diguanylate cyclase, partial [Halanaerobiales bacterium]|nr:diguanylate cyclase [Halanaerobiales bacterium]
MKNSKKFYIWAFIVLAVISFSFYFQYRSNNQILEKNTRQITETNVDLLNEKINNWLNNRAQLINDAKNYIAMDQSNKQQILDYLKELLDQNKSFFSIYFGTPDNRMINASGWQMPEGFDLRDRPWYQKAVAENSLVYTKAFINASRDDIIITVAAPVYSNNDNTFLGVIAGDVLITTIISFVEKESIIEDGYFMLIDSQNNVLAHPDIKYSLEQGLPVLEDKYDQYIKRKKIDGIITEDITENEKKGFFTYTNIKNTDWILASFTPLKYYTEAFSQLYMSFIFAIITSLLVTIIFLWFQNIYVIKPLLQFNNNIRKIDIEDSLNYRLPGLKNSEFNYLVESVNNVLAKAQDYFIELREKKDSINYIANHDSLTDLPNRRNFMEHLSSVLKADKKGAVIFIDLDNFKEINDTMGHAFGDKVLLEIANNFEEIKEKNTFISRFGGDEFLILVERNSDLVQLNKYIEMINTIFERPVIINDTNFHIGFSMG